MELDYQEIISVVADFLKIGLPIGIIFGVVDWGLDFFFSCAFPWFKKNRSD